MVFIFSGAVAALAAVPARADTLVVVLAVNDVLALTDVLVAVESAKINQSFLVIGLPFAAW
ncbi:MAG: hypothetical protein ABF676_12435 [Schleiferilactobacillus harbinensis]|jgi:hypothetical protein|uniref:hypothetical protein n=1 Tax=Schleiferilactobacillus harbinensis TaxID=304207 RepID=UPI0039ECD11A